MKCPKCKGYGFWWSWETACDEDCPRCCGTGEVEKEEQA